MPNHHKCMQMSRGKFSISRKKRNMPQHALISKAQYRVETKYACFSRQWWEPARTRLCVCVWAMQDDMRAIKKTPSSVRRDTKQRPAHDVKLFNGRRVQKTQVNSKRRSSNDNVSLFLLSRKALMPAIHTVLVSAHVLQLVGCPAEFRQEL